MSLNLDSVLTEKTYTVLFGTGEINPSNAEVTFVQNTRMQRF